MRELSGPVEFDTPPTAPDPTEPTQLATKEYVDAHDGGGGGSGTVTSVNDVEPADGNVTLTAADVGALALDGDGSELTGITAAQVGADVSGAAATAQSNAETYAAGVASTAQSNAETYAAAQAAAAQSAAEAASLPLSSGTAVAGRVPVATGTGDESAWGAVADQAADIARVFGAGHSYMSGYQNTEGGERYMTRLTAGLHAEEVTYAVTQAVLARDSSSSQPGGYANVLNALTPRIASASSYSPRNYGPYVPLSPVVVFDYGFNDLTFLTATTATNAAWYQMALTACCCVARAGGYFPDTDASVAFASHWTANAGEQEFGSPTNHSTTTTGDTVTITVPADFPGGEVDILTLAYAGGAKWSAKVDGGAAQVLDGTGSAYGSASGRANLVVQRLTGLAAGAHTIVATVEAIDGGAMAFFDSWLIAAPQPPLTVLVNQPAAPCLPLSTSGAHTPVTASDVTALNAAITAVAAAFADGNAVVADIAAAFANFSGNAASGSPNSLYYSDNLHPNILGHGVIAQVIASAIRSAPLPSAARYGPTGLVMRQIGGPLEPQFGAGWSSAGWAYFTKDRSGRVTLNAELANTSSPDEGSQIFTVPPGYNPIQNVIQSSSASWGSGYTTANPTVVYITTAGEVAWYIGDPSTQFDLSATWIADGLGS